MTTDTETKDLIKENKEAMKTLLGKSKSASSGVEAMQFSQAVLNLTQVQNQLEELLEAEGNSKEG